VMRAFRVVRVLKLVITQEQSYDAASKGTGNLPTFSSNRHVTERFILHVSCRALESKTM
jgi:hypothetical protein